MAIDEDLQPRAERWSVPVASASSWGDLVRASVTVAAAILAVCGVIVALSGMVIAGIVLLVMERAVGTESRRGRFRVAGQT